LITIFYSIDTSEGWDIAGRQTAIFFMPVILALNEIDLNKYKTQLFKIFAFTCTVVVLYLYADAIRTITYFHLPLKDIVSTAFINHNFSLPIAMHATYLSMYIAFSIVVLLYALFTETANKIIILCCLLILCAGLIQLTSRAVVIGMMFIFSIAIPLFLIKGKKRVAFAVIALALTAGSISLISKIDAFKTRYVTELNNDLTQAAINNEILEPRAARWELAFNLIKKSPVVGYGTGSEKKLLKELYYKNKLYISFLKEFNVHSQFLSFIIRSGIIGLLIYLTVLGFGFTVAVQKKDFVFFSFLILIAAVSVSENILDLNKGIFFYSFFLSIFLISNNSKLFYKGNCKSI
jgi:O-antigen ligase